MSDESRSSAHEHRPQRMFSFDALADSFEETSDLPAAAGEPIRAALMEAVSAGPATRFLELGAGTGLIARPFIEAGAWYTAVDASAAMLQQLQSKLSDRPYPATLLVSDLADKLPFPSSSYHVIIASRVLHRLDLDHILPEIPRTLKPRGHLVIGRVRRPSSSVRMTLRRTLRALMREMGYEPWPPEGLEREMLARLEALGAQPRGERRAYSWSVTQTPREPIDLWSARAGFGAQPLPPEVKAAMLDRLRAWALETYGSLDSAETSEHHYVLHVMQF